MKFVFEEIKISHEDKLNIRGWCFSEEGVENPQVKVEINGKVAANFSPGGDRPDVLEHFPEYPQAGKSGFIKSIPLPQKSGRVRIFVSDRTESKEIFKKSLKELFKERPDESPGIPVRFSLQKFFKLTLTIIKTLLSIIRKAYQVIRYERGFKLTPREVYEYLEKARCSFYEQYTKARILHNAPFNLPKKEDPYKIWIKHNTLSERHKEALQKAQDSFSYQPLISIVMPVWNVETTWLEKAFTSIRNQTYTNWELCIADDASTMPTVKPFLEQAASTDSRIKIIFRKENGNISLASNSAAELASGEFILLMDNDDELTPNALFEIVRLLQSHPDADIIYSDDDKIDQNGNRYDPQFKPDWSPELLLSYMYFSHLFCIRTTLFNKVGGFRARFEGTQDYDLALRLTELTERIYHIPKVLYHWRAIAGSTATSGLAKPEAFERGIRAVRDAINRRNLPVSEVRRPDFAVNGGLGIFCLSWPDEGPGVTIIIQACNQLSVLKRCLDSLQKTTYKNYEVLIIDSISDDPETSKYLQSLPYRVERIDSTAGSLAQINNEAVKRTDSELVLFLSNHAEVINGNWLSQMVGYMKIPGVGAAGARLLNSDGSIKNAGQLIGLYEGLAGPAFKQLPGRDLGYLAYTRVTRNFSALSSEGLLVKRSKFLKVGGFDDETFSNTYFDVDLCLRLRNQNYRLVYVPEAELKIIEDNACSLKQDPGAISAFRKKYKGCTDPYYNPNLSLDNEQFQISTRSTLDYFSLMNKRPKMLMAGHNLNLEGAPFSQFELTCGLIDRGNIEIEVYCPKDGPLRKLYEDKGIKVHIFDSPLSEVANLEQYNKAAAKLGEWILNQSFDVVYANTLLNFYVIDSAGRISIPTIWNIRESEPFINYFDYLPVEIRHRGIEAFSFPYRVIFVAEATRQLFEPLDSGRTFTVIHNGLQKSRITDYCQQTSKQDARAILGIPENKKMVLIVGTVCPRKGQLDFARAAVKLLKQGLKDVCFYIVGGRASDYLTEIENLIFESAAQEDIRIIMETDKTYDYYRAADIFVCSSYGESYPRIILEAMAFGLPIVTTPVFGIREQVMENVNALFYEPGDDEKLTHNLELILTDKDIWKTFASNSPTVLECITSYDEMVKMYENHMLGAWMTNNAN